MPRIKPDVCSFGVHAPSPPVRLGIILMAGGDVRGGNVAVAAASDNAASANDVSANAISAAAAAVSAAALALADSIPDSAILRTYAREPNSFQT